MRATASAVLVLALAALLPSQDPSVAAAEAKAKAQAKAAATVQLVRLAGVFVDQPQSPSGLGALLAGPEGKPKAFYTVLKTIEGLADNSSGRILLDLSGAAQINLPQLAELERAIAKLRKSGKQVFAYVENAGTVGVQIASMCDRVLMADMGTLDMPSMSLSVTFLADALDMLGIEIDVVRCGDFKGAVEPFTRGSMSDHLRQHYLQLVGSINTSLVNRLAKGRRLSAEQVRKLQARRLFIARQALEAGLVDELVPWAGAKKAMGKVVGDKQLVFVDVLKKSKKRKSMNVFQLMSTLLNPAKKAAATKGLVVLHLSGAIMDGVQESQGSIVSGPTVKLIRRVAGNDKVKGVVVRINSPGGSATASEAVLLALQELAKKKPVAVSMGNLAASGGYYISCLGRPIFAEDGTITGSIGVFGLKPSLGKLMTKIGLKDELVALDEGPAMGSLDRLWTEDQKATVQGLVNDVYDRFLGHVSRSRNLSKDVVRKIAGGRVWSGRQALANKLVDHIGGLEGALALVAKEAGVEPGTDVTHLPLPKDPFTALAEQLMEVRAILPDPALRALAQRSRSLERGLQVLLDTVASERPTRIWAVLPEMLRVQ